MTDLAKLAAGLTEAETETEEWKPFPGFEGIYDISNLGNVWSRPRVAVGRGGRPLPINGRMLKPSANRTGYLFVRPHKDGQSFSREIHRFVCIAFHGPAPKGYQAAHLNGNKQDNRACNLAWASPAENARHKWDHGTMLHGEKCPYARINKAKANVIVLRCHFSESMYDIAEDYGITERAVRNIRDGISWAIETEALRRHLLDQEKKG